MEKKKELFNRVIVCGYGIVGQRIVDSLRRTTLISW